MPITATDVEARLSTQTGAAGSSTASTPAESIGKFMSTTPLTDASPNNLFRNITAAEAATGITLYRCLFVVNTHATGTWEQVKFWILSQIAGGGTIAIGLDPAGAVAFDLGSAQAAAPADEETAPSGVTFAAPTSIDDALSLGDIAAEECYALWFRLTVPPDVEALALDNVKFRVRGMS